MPRVPRSGGRGVSLLARFDAFVCGERQRRTGRYFPSKNHGLLASTSGFLRS